MPLAGALPRSDDRRIMDHRETRQLAAHERRQLAATAEVAEETLRRYLRGDPIRGLSRARIERALRASGAEVDSRGSRDG